jgi:hypothetical protein
MEEEVLAPTQMSRFYHWVKMGLTSAGTIKWIVFLLAGTGAATNATVQEMLVDNLPSWGDATEVVVPIPTGQTVVPQPAGINPQVILSLQSLQAAVDQHTAALLAVKEDLIELEERREAESDRDDDVLENRIVGLEGFHD